MNNNININLGDGIDFSIIFADTFLDKDTGKEITYKDSIKLRSGSNYFRLTAMSLSRLAVALQDPEIRKVLQERFLAEKSKLPEAKGF